MRYLVTGGAGFIGSNFVRYLFNKYGDDAQVVNLDKRMYAGIRENLAEYEGKPNYRFLHGDIANAEDVAEGYKGVDGSGVDVVVNFAAESHVDRSLIEAGTFIETDVHGVLVLLEEARKHAPKLRRFIQISTDEVYGSIAEGSFTESDALNPRNPYSASKAGGDRMAFAYAQTYELPVIVTRASNNFGPYQYPEKLLPRRFRRGAGAHGAVVRRSRAVVARDQRPRRGIQGVLPKTIRRALIANARAQ